MLLMSIVAVLAFNGCAARPSGGNIFNQPITMSIPADLSYEDRNNLIYCVNMENTRRMEQGLLGIRLTEKPTKSERSLQQMAFYGAAPLTFIGAILNGPSQISRERERPVIERNIRQCVAYIREQQQIDRYAGHHVQRR